MRGVIAAGHRLTAEVGADVLRSGGTALDAAVAALAMACLCEPVLCSPGGGGFAMVRDGTTGATQLIDFFPQTPRVRRDVPDGSVRQVFADFGTATQAFHIGPATTAVPGFVAGLETLVDVGATRPLEDLFAPAISAAREGVVVTEFQHHLSTVVAPILTATRSASALFAPGGRLIPAGGMLRNPGLADALEELSGRSFRGGDVAAACLAAQDGRGHLDVADFDAYEVVRRDPLALRVGGSTVSTNPLPAAGGTLVAHTLLQLASAQPVDMALALRVTAEARAAADGDLAALAERPVRQRGTTHLSVIDAHGTVCSVTTSNGEGNGELVGGYGFMLNNVLGEEDVNPDGIDAWPPDTRLSSMMCPTIMEGPDGTLTALGSGGSNRIRSAISQVIAGLALAGRDLPETVDSPRLHVEGRHLDFEDQFAESVRNELVSAFPDHRAWPRADMFFGGVHCVTRAPDGSMTGHGDARRDGHAIVVSP